MRAKSKSIAAAAAGLGLLISVASGPAAFASEGPGTNAVKCDPVSKYKVSTTYEKNFKRIGSGWIDYNGTTTSQTFDTSVTGSGTVGTSLSGTVTAKGGANIGVITLGVDASTTASVSSSITVSGTHAVHLSVPAKKYGLAAMGGWRIYTQGTYTTVTGECATTSDTIKAKTPQDGNGFNTATNSTGDFPWD